MTASSIYLIYMSKSLDNQFIKMLMNKS